MPVHPQAQAHLDRLAATRFADMHTLAPAQIREGMRRMLGALPPPQPIAHVEDRTLATDAGPLKARIYHPAPQERRPVLVFFHGGGFVLGDLDTHDGLARALAAASGAVVVSVDYPLAPEHKYPAAPNAAYEATAWVARHAAALGGDGARLAVAGDSAGGNLAAVACQQLRGSGIALRHQLLLYPYLDCSDAAAASASYRECAQGYFLGAAELDWYRAQYLTNPADATDVRASPLHQRELHGLPPATIITAEYDPLRDQGEAYGEALQRAGGSATVRRWPGQFHGFISMQGMIDAASDALDAAAASLRQAFGSASRKEAA
jgi:acetyl esterase